MSYAESILPEFDQEMGNTRELLARIPEDKLDWRAHAKCNTIGWNANHVADLSSWVKMALTSDSFDVAPVDGPRYQSPKLTKVDEILDRFDQNVAEARAAIAGITDEEIAKPWSLLHGGQPILTLPRSAVVRSFVLNHLIHHRAHLCVYLRLNDVPLPGMYGPSGDQ